MKRRTFIQGTMAVSVAPALPLIAQEKPQGESVSKLVLFSEDKPVAEADLDILDRATEGYTITCAPATIVAAGGSLVVDSAYMEIDNLGIKVKLWEGKLCLKDGDSVTFTNISLAICNE